MSNCSVPPATRKAVGLLFHSGFPPPPFGFRLFVQNPISLESAETLFSAELLFLVQTGFLVQGQPMLRKLYRK
jgi:hypothetical protein